MVHRLLKAQLDHEPHCEVDPDLCVSLGAAIQGGLIAGVDVGPVLIDITPHTLGIECLGVLHGRLTDKVFSAVIHRNTPLPASRSEIYYTAQDGQDAARIRVFQGENDNTRFNKSVGEFLLDGLNEEAEEGNEILVRFELNLDGILKVTAAERETGREKQIVVDNAITRFRAKDQDEAKARLSEMFGDSAADETLAAAGATDSLPPESPSPLFENASNLLAKARRLIPQASAEDAAEMRELIDQLQRAIEACEMDRVKSSQEKLDDLLFYLQDA